MRKLAVALSAPALASARLTLCSMVKRRNIALIAGAGARSICTCNATKCAFQSCATVQAVDKAASPAPLLINGNKTLRMAMIWTLQEGLLLTGCGKTPERSQFAERLAADVG